VALSATHWPMVAGLGVAETVTEVTGIAHAEVAVRVPRRQIHVRMGPRCGRVWRLMAGYRMALARTFKEDDNLLKANGNNKSRWLQPCPDTGPTVPCHGSDTLAGRRTW